MMSPGIGSLAIGLKNAFTSATGVTSTPIQSAFLRMTKVRRLEKTRRGVKRKITKTMPFWNNLPPSPVKAKHTTNFHQVFGQQFMTGHQNFQTENSE